MIRIFKNLKIIDFYNNYFLSVNSINIDTVNLNVRKSPKTKT